MDIKFINFSETVDPSVIAIGLAILCVFVFVESRVFKKPEYPDIVLTSLIRLMMFSIFVMLGHTIEKMDLSLEYLAVINLTILASILSFIDPVYSKRVAVEFVIISIAIFLVIS